MLRNCKRAAKRTVLLGKNVIQSILYRFVKQKGSIRAPQKIVFVCTGNICRSAFAEKYLKAELGKETPVIESCGLVVEVPSPPPHTAIRAAGKIGLDLKGHISKSIACCDIESTDLILAMEYGQYLKLVELFPHKRLHIRLLREFAPFPENLLCNIDDPFGLSVEHFERCFARIQRSVVSICFEGPSRNKRVA